jgi:MFS family permease
MTAGAGGFLDARQAERVACLVIPGGAAGDRFGRKGVLLAGLVLFAAGALMSAAAPNVALLLASRAVTGVGAAAVLPNTLAVLLHAVPAERRSATIAIWASMTGIGGVVGNVGGGAVLSGGSWRWLFAAAVPISLVLAPLARRVALVGAVLRQRVFPAVRQGIQCSADWSGDHPADRPGHPRRTACRTPVPAHRP